MLDEIETEINKFAGKDEMIRGFNAVKFCYEKNLIQQGITILLEHLITIIGEKGNIQIKLENSTNNNKKRDKDKIRDNRNLITGVLKYHTKSEYKQKEWKWKDYQKGKNLNALLEDSFVAEIASKYAELGNYRNDINHGGFIFPENSTAFVYALKEIYNQIILIVCKHYKINKTEKKALLL